MTANQDYRTLEGNFRRFELRRDEDVTGMSGVGVVAQGVKFGDSVVCVHWLGEWHSTVVHERGMEQVEFLHLHGGKTRIVWLDEEAA